jgi:hypothetical protein
MALSGCLAMAQIGSRGNVTGTKVRVISWREMEKFYAGIYGRHLVLSLQFYRFVDPFFVARLIFMRNNSV